MPELAAGDVVIQTGGVEEPHLFCGEGDGKRLGTHDFAVHHRRQLLGGGEGERRAVKVGEDLRMLPVVTCGIGAKEAEEGKAAHLWDHQHVQDAVIRLGVSQISGGSRTSVGGYAEEERPTDTEQFDVSDQRTLDEVVRWLMEMGYIPSFCTACYREGRTGDRFMSLCKSGQIQNCCHPNALMTLKEYLMDYASEETKKIGEALIQAELQNIPKEKVREICADHLQKIEEGVRDFRF